MAQDLEKLVVQLSADVKGYERAMQRAVGLTNRQARAIENRTAAMGKRLDGIGKSAANSLLRPLGAIGGALAVTEVARYADAWTRANNSLAIAGVTGARQADILERIYQSAQANGAPLEAMAGLFGKAAQASDNLGASQSEMLKFTDGVGVALKVAGTSATQAQGALTQLGQALGQARVMAEEFNSINEGARPILMAVAHGLDEAGGSVSKLKQLVNDGKVSGQQFFQAFLKGLPTIQAMAKNATQTIEQGITKVSNAFTKYIGQTDESLGASTRLSAGLNALADNFDQTADVVLQVASVIAGALVGRSLGGMIVKMGLATAAAVKLVAAIRTIGTASALAGSFGGLAAAAGPLGLVIGGTVVGALALFSSSSAEAKVGAEAYAKALEAVEERAKTSGDAVAAAGEKYREAQKNTANAGLAEAQADIESIHREFEGFIKTMDHASTREFVSKEQLSQLAVLFAELKSGDKTAEELHDELSKLARTSYNGETMAQFLQPLLEQLDKAIQASALLKDTLKTLAEPTARAAETASMAAYEKMAAAGKAFTDEALRRASLSKDQLALEKEIADVKKESAEAGATLTKGQIEALAQARIAGNADRSSEGKKPKKTADDRFADDVRQIRDRTAAVVAETQAMASLNPLINDYGFAVEKASAAQSLLSAAKEAELADTPTLRAEIDKLATAYATASADAQKLAESQDKVREKAEEFKALGQDVLKGFINDMKSSETRAEALSNALGRIADKLLDMSLNSLFDGIGKGGGSGIFGSLSKLLGFSDGGFTGHGGKYAPAGMVHKGEYVFSKQAVQRAGLGNLDAMHRSLKGHANGGAVAMSAPRLPKVGQAGKTAGGPISITTTIDARGADQAAIARLEQAQATRDAQLRRDIPALVRSAQSRGISLR